MRPSLFAAAVSVLASAVLATGQSSDRQTFRSGREILTIEASVRGADGMPLTDLRPSDFTVRVDGQPRAVLAARRFGADTAARLDSNPIGSDASAAPSP